MMPSSPRPPRPPPPPPSDAARPLEPPIVHLSSTVVDSVRQTRHRYSQEEQQEGAAQHLLLLVVDTRTTNDDGDNDGNGGGASGLLNSPEDGGCQGGVENEEEEQAGIGPLHLYAHCKVSLPLLHRWNVKKQNASLLSSSMSPTAAATATTAPTFDQAGTLGPGRHHPRDQHRQERRRATALVGVVVALAAASTAVTVSFFLHSVNHHPGRRTGTAATNAAGTRMDTARRDAGAPPSSVGDVAVHQRAVQQLASITDQNGNPNDREHDDQVLLQSRTMIPFVLGAHRLSRSITSPNEHGSTASAWFPRIGPNVGNADALRQIPLVVASTRTVEKKHVPCRGTLVHATLPSVHALACPYDDGDDDDDHEDLSIVGFVRITKTASTAMLSFLNGLVPQQLVTYDHLLHFPSFFQEVAGGDFRTMRSIIPACVFGAAPNVAADPATTTRATYPTATNSNETGAALLPAYAWQCPHTTYRGVVATWARGLPFLRNPNRPSINISIADEKDDVVSSSTASSASLHMFTVVREPTDRFVSYFHYWRQIYPHWKELATTDEHDRMLQGDLEGFLELQSQLSTSSLTINSAFQYRYLNENVDEAIAMVQNSPVRVLVLVNECFELSLRLLAAAFPHLVTEKDVNAFVQQTSHQKYTQGNTSIPIVLRATSDVRQVQPIHMDELRNKSRTWLHDDYRFYRAAVNQFRQSIEASTLDPDLIRECYRRLDGSV